MGIRLDGEGRGMAATFCPNSLDQVKRGFGCAVRFDLSHHLGLSPVKFLESVRHDFLFPAVRLLT
jgi:hypothetical protein